MRGFPYFTNARGRGLRGYKRDDPGREGLMSDRAELLREADHAFGELREAIGGLAEEQMGRVWLGTWGVREILIHVSGWHRAMTPALEHIARGEAPYPPGTYDDFNAWSAVRRPGDRCEDRRRPRGARGVPSGLRGRGRRRALAVL